MSTEVVERVAHIALGVVLLVGLALFARYTINPPPASAGPPSISAPPPHVTALDGAPAAVNVSLTTCER